MIVVTGSIWCVPSEPSSRRSSGNSSGSSSSRSGSTLSSLSPFWFEISSTSFKSAMDSISSMAPWNMSSSNTTSVLTGSLEESLTLSSSPIPRFSRLFNASSSFMVLPIFLPFASRFFVSGTAVSELSVCISSASASISSTDSSFAAASFSFLYSTILGISIVSFDILEYLLSYFSCCEGVSGLYCIFSSIAW